MKTCTRGTVLLLTILVCFRISYSQDSAENGDGSLFRFSITKRGSMLGDAMAYAWIPGNPGTIRTVIVHLHGCTREGDARQMMYDIQWRALAKKWHAVLLAPAFVSGGNAKACINWYQPDNGSDTVFLEMLDTLAVRSGHPEISRVPWALWGHSGGSLWVTAMTGKYPGRVAVAVAEACGFDISDSAATWKVPMLHHNGIQDLCYNNADIVARGRRHGALWAHAVNPFVESPMDGHQVHDLRFLAIPWMDACMSERLPDQPGSTRLRDIDPETGWLGDTATRVIAAAANYHGDPSAAYWFPSRSLAEKWAEYMRKGTVTDRTPPPAPDRLEGVFEGYGIRLSWHAEPDLESGIKTFIIYRNRKQLKTLVYSTRTKFSKETGYQRWNDGDQPVPIPAPPQVFIDSTVDNKGEYTYQVSTVNWSGVEGGKSAELVLKNGKIVTTKPGNIQPAFNGAKSSWHDGFVRYDFILDTATGVISPFPAPAGEGLGVKEPPPGKRRCILIAPEKPAIGNPWSWRGCYWDHQPQTEIKLLHRGFYIAYISAGATMKPDAAWDDWYAFLTAHGLSSKPAFIGMSRGGQFEYDWATQHPDQVSCIYADNPAVDSASMARLGLLAANDVPLLHVCGSFDPLYAMNTLPVEEIYHAFGGRISVMLKEGFGHHPHSLRDPVLIAGFITRSVYEKKETSPAFTGSAFRMQRFYTNVNTYRFFPAEDAYIACRGPLFTPCYTRYEIQIPGVDAFTTVIVPRKAARGNPWIFRADYAPADSLTAGLLAKGFYIVTGAVPYNYDGPVLQQWNTIYRYLTGYGFSRKPVMSGKGGAAGEVIAWAVENPGSISAIYAENPVLKSRMMPEMPVAERLPVLLKASIPILFVCGEKDPSLNSGLRTAEKKYKASGGKIDLLVSAAEGHFLSQKKYRVALDFILRAAQ